MVSTLFALVVAGVAKRLRFSFRVTAYSYLRNPEAIYAESFRQIRAAVDFSIYDEATAKLVERLVHTNGRIEVAQRLVVHAEAIRAGIEALNRGAPLFCDARMVVEGIIDRLLPMENAKLCGLDQVPFQANAKDTRSAKAVELWDGLDGANLAGSIVAIGNAPTALFRLMETLQAGGPAPALVIAMPVGFVGAAESKQALLDDFPLLPSIVIKGREGGSAYAAAAVNALASLATQAQGGGS